MKASQRVAGFSAVFCGAYFLLVACDTPSDATQAVPVSRPADPVVGRITCVVASGFRHPPATYFDEEFIDLRWVRGGDLPVYAVEGPNGEKWWVDVGSCVVRWKNRGGSAP
ncbi:MAG TPA: hypothetical protein VEA38_25460 [Terriglobales bacterium]|nr:hypothetical protein [Terriglobales bacterium]